MKTTEPLIVRLLRYIEANSSTTSTTTAKLGGIEVGIIIAQDHPEFARKLLESFDAEVDKDELALAVTVANEIVEACLGVTSQ